MITEYTGSISKKLDSFSVALKNFIKSNQSKLLNLEATNLKLGLYHLRSNNINDAILRFKIVIFLNNKNADAYYNLARCQLSKGQKDKAKDNLKQCLAINSKHKEAKFFEKLFNKDIEVDEVPTSIVHDYYQTFANNYDAEFNSELGYFVPEDLVKIISKNKKIAGNILDLGCGTGVIGFKLKEIYKDPEIIGVDLSDRMLEQLQIKQKQRSIIAYEKLIKNDLILYLQKSELKFDIITSCLSLHYSNSIVEPLKKISSMLKKDGVVAFAVETKEHAHKKFMLNPGYENFCFSKSYIENQIKDAKLEVITSMKSTIKNDRIALIFICQRIK